MIAISANQLTKRYGIEEILSDISFHINTGDRVGIVGANGAGKSTLLNILAGELPCDSGNYYISTDLKVGYFRQNDTFTSENTVYEEMLSIFSHLIRMEEEMACLSQKIADLSAGLSMVPKQSADAATGVSAPQLPNDTDGAGAKSEDIQNDAHDAGGGHSASAVTSANPKKTAVASDKLDTQADIESEIQRLLAEYDRLSESFRLQNGYGYRSEITGVLNSMAFPPSFFDKKTSSLSGGERTRLALAALLLKKPDILLLDEPTNHLDIGTLKWLEQYLRSYQGAVVIVSHDRYFLDHTVNRIFEIENKRLGVYEGNYTFYVREKKVRFVNDLKAYEKQQAEIRRQEDMVRRFKERGTEKLAKRAKSREKILERMEAPERPMLSNAQMKIQFKESSKSGNDTLQAIELSKSYGTGAEKRTLFSNVSFEIKRGERICIIGPNGTGKTTLLRMLTSEISPTKGHIKVGHNVIFGYYDQHQTMLSETSTVIEEMRDAYALYSDTQLRGLLGRFLFRGDDVFKTVGSLSGGERARLALLKLMLSGANTLILDEPTNHLDIVSREVFEDALLDFPGTSIIVSHDRYLLNKVPTSIYELTKDGITIFPGNYDYYNEKKAAVTSTNAYMSGLGHDAASDTDAAAQNQLSGKQQRIDERKKAKALQAQQRRKERRIESLEDLITQLEGEIGELEQKLCSEEYMTDYKKLDEFSNELAQKKDTLAAAYEEWETLSDDNDEVN